MIAATGRKLGTDAVNSQAPENTIRGMCCASLIYRQYSMACRGWVDWTHFSHLFSLDARSVDTLKRQLIEGQRVDIPQEAKITVSPSSTSMTIKHCRVWPGT